MERWWKAEQGHVHSEVVQYTQEVERRQSFLYERFFRLRCLYDPYLAHLYGYASYEHARSATASENVIADCVNTVVASIAATKVDPRVQTEGGDWSAQRRARHLEWYARGLVKKLDLHDMAVKAAHDASLTGTGCLKICARDKDILVERVLVDDIVVDEAECRSGPPRQLGQRAFYDRDVLAEMFPDYEMEIHSAPRTSITHDHLWAGYRQIEDDQIVVIEMWRLPAGDAKGRHAIVIDGATLLDEEYEETYFPFAFFFWELRASGWYGIGGAERIAPIQLRINKLNTLVDRAHDKWVYPTQYVHQSDASLMVKSRNETGDVVPYRHTIPTTVIPQAVSGETYNRLDKLRALAFEEFGVSKLAATAMKPSGLDSGVALREYRDQTTQRFALQEQGYESAFLRTVWLALLAAKQLGDDAPEVVKKSRWGAREIKWADVDPGELKIQIAAASNLAKTPAGQQQLAMEMAQAGIVSQDEARRLMRHPDTERALSLYTISLENVEEFFEHALDGEQMVPEPYQHLKMLVWRGQMIYLKAQEDGAPEEILENVRQAIVQAAWMLEPPAPDPMADPAMAGADPAMAGDPMADPAATMQGGMPPLDPTAPQAAPQTALAADMLMR